jgi:LmbE family N-acetylglucosaminyl deacetylase
MSVVTPGATLYLLAHHDDEVFCAGRIWADRAAGRRPFLLWATAGGLAPAGRRQAECRRVARLLDLPAGTAVSLGWPDQGAVDHLVQIFAAAVWLLDESQADCVCAPAYEGGHPDHDAMNVVAARLRSRRPELRVEEFALYRRGHGGLAVKAPWPAADAPANRPPGQLAPGQLGDEWAARRPPAAPLAPAARALRRRLMCANVSQLATSLAPLAALARAQGTWLSEPVRELPQHDYSRPPHRGTLLYELYTKRRFGGFAAAAAAFHE